MGGAAATAQGSTRLTLDLDVVYSHSDRNLKRLQETVVPLRPYLRGAPPGLPFVLDVDTLRRGLSFTLTTSLGELDLPGEVAGGGGCQDLLPETEEVVGFGITCRCLTRRRLIAVKRAAGRPEDLEATAELEALLEEREREHSQERER